MPGIAVGSLTYSDKKSMLAAALRIQTYRIDDVSDTEVFYSTEDETSTFRGTYKRTYKIENNTVTLGEPIQVLKRTVYEPLVVVGTFSLDRVVPAAGDDEEVVMYRGKVFEAGDYPDKGFSITEEELALVPADFAPVDNDINHDASILDGKLGKLQAVEAVGKELFGTLAIPKWLRDKVGDSIKVSLAWINGATKQIVGNALVLSPRISDAEVVAAFNAASAASIVAANTTHGGACMERKWYEKLLGLHKDKQLPEGFEDFDPGKVEFAEEAAPAIVPGPVATTAADDQAASFAQSQVELAGLRANQLITAAGTFYEDALKAGKCLPAERDALIAMFKQAAQDDNLGTACFDASGTLKEGDRVKALRAMVEARPKMNLTEELIPGTEPQLVVLSGGAPSGKMSTERREELIDAGTIKVEKGKGG